MTFGRPTARTFASPSAVRPRERNDGDGDDNDDDDRRRRGRLVVLTQNVLARSLGSNTIPWCTTLSSPELESRVDAALSSSSSSCASWSEWKRTVATPTYAEHFHKNLASGNYTAMRALWGARSVDERAVREIPNVAVKGEDAVSYRSENGRVVVARTLRGALRTDPALADAPSSSSFSSLADEVFEDVVSSEERVFDWVGARGPRVFRATTRTRADVIALQEYDVHSARARYREDEKERTFADAMASEGYAGVFFTDPLLDRDPPSGLAVYWRHDRFVLCDARGRTVSSSSNDDDVTRCVVLPCGESLGGDDDSPAAVNVDLEERWTRRPGEAPERMPDADRRNVAVVRLRERAPPHRALHVINAHLMTTSRDRAATNAYPGEVRAGELATIQNVVRTRAASVDGAPPTVVFLGDLNTEPTERSVFAGVVPLSSNRADVDAPSTRTLDTGLAANDDDDDADAPPLAFRWTDARGAPCVLRNAFADEQRKGTGCTSRNADRCSWIDYVWYTAKDDDDDDDGSSSLSIEWLSDTTPPANRIPNETHGSDHLPVAVGFLWGDNKEKE